MEWGKTPAPYEGVRGSGERARGGNPLALSASAASGLAEQGLVDHVLVLRPTGAAGRSAAVADCPDDRFLGEPPTSTDLASFLHTGGTTGAPELAARTHANEITDAWMIAATPYWTRTRPSSPRCPSSTSTRWS